jgi:hypothetical protein
VAPHLEETGWYDWQLRECDARMRQHDDDDNHENRNNACVDKHEWLTRIRRWYLQLILIHFTSSAHTHIDHVRLPPAIVTVQLQNTHAALAPTNAL